MSIPVALEDKTLAEDALTMEWISRTFQDETRMTGGGDLEVAAHPDLGEGDRGVMVLPDPTIARDRGATVYPDLTIVVTEALLRVVIGKNVVHTIIKMRIFHQTDTEGMEAIEIMDTDPGVAETLGILTEDTHTHHDSRDSRNREHGRYEDDRRDHRSSPSIRTASKTPSRKTCKD